MTTSQQVFLEVSACAQRAVETLRKFALVFPHLRFIPHERPVDRARRQRIARDMRRVERRRNRRQRCDSATAS